MLDLGWGVAWRCVGNVRAKSGGGMMKSVHGYGMCDANAMFMVGFHSCSGGKGDRNVDYRYSCRAGTPANHAFRRGSLATRRAQSAYRMRCGKLGFMTLRVISDVCGGGSMCARDCVLCFACVMGRFGTPQITPEMHGWLRRGKRRRVSEISVWIAIFICGNSCPIRCDAV